MKLRGIQQSFAFLNQCFLLDYCSSHTQVAFISNVATPHKKIPSKRSQLASNLIFCRRVGSQNFWPVPSLL